MQIMEEIRKLNFPPSFTTIVLLFIGMLIFFLYLNKKIDNFNPLKVTSNFQIIVEDVFIMFEKMVEDNVGKSAVPVLTPIIIVLFLSIFIGNAVALIALREAAFRGYFALVWGVSMFFLWNGYAIYKIGIGKYVKGFFQPNFIFFPLEVVGMLSKVLSITVRLIGNIGSGVVIMSLIFAIPVHMVETSALLGTVAGVIFVPIIAAFSFYFSIFSPLIQALVFSMLTLGNISVLISEE